jgi:hypothetical protein
MKNPYLYLRIKYLIVKFIKQGGFSEEEKFDRIK